VQIEHSRKFVVKLVGTMREFDREKLRDYLRGMILTTAKTTIAREIVKNRTSILEIAAQLTEISTGIQTALSEQLAEFGLTLVNFFVSSIDVKDDDKSILTLRDALAKRAEMAIVGYTYQQERSLNALEGAAGFTAAEYGVQPAANSGIIGLGVGLGVGVPLGTAIGQQFSNAVVPQLEAGAPTRGGMSSVPPATGGPGAVGIACAKCTTTRLDPAAKFCPICGTAYPEPVTLNCGSCKTPLSPGVKFCPECGTPTASKCGGCGAELGPSAKFCPECGIPRGRAS
jgi:membrane protease subunit (stomatin/prohibitin family)